MHVLLIHQAFTRIDEPGGTRHHELARYLAGCGHQVTVIGSPVSYLTGEARHAEAPAELQEKGVRIIRAYTYPALHRSFVHRMLSFLSFMFSAFYLGLGVRDVDVVWGTSPPIFQGVTAWALSRLKRVPLLFEVRDLWPAFAVAVGVLQQPLLIRASEWLERFLYRGADLVLVNSPGFIDHVESRGARRVKLVPNGVDTGMFEPHIDGRAIRQANGWQGKFVALYAGAHGLSNDLDVVLDAGHRLVDQSEILIALLGDGKEKPYLVARAKSMGLDNVRFLPPVPKSEMPRLLAAADACIAILKPISWYATVYPNKVFDYMAAGRPVILAIDGVIREVVETAGAGLFVQPGDPQALAEAIRSLADNRATGQAMGLAGRRHVEQHFDRRKLGDQLVGLLEVLA